MKLNTSRAGTSVAVANSRSNDLTRGSARYMSRPSATKIVLRRRSIAPIGRTVSVSSPPEKSASTKIGRLDPTDLFNHRTLLRHCCRMIDLDDTNVWVFSCDSHAQCVEASAQHNNLVYSIRDRSPHASFDPTLSHHPVNDDAGVGRAGSKSLHAARPIAGRQLAISHRPAFETDKNVSLHRAASGAIRSAVAGSRAHSTVAPAISRAVALALPAFMGVGVLCKQLPVVTIPITLEDTSRVVSLFHRQKLLKPRVRPGDLTRRGRAMIS